MGSEIQLKSEKSKGSHFFFELTCPIIENIENQKVEKTSNLKTEKLEGKNILIAEDNKVNILILKTILEKQNAFLNITYNGAEALLAAKENKYDVILMDLDMPVMNGEVAIKKIREFDTNTPIIIITASNSFNIISLKEYNIFSVIRKPFTANEIIDTISNVI